jgi:hypothetical protein
MTPFVGNYSAEELEAGRKAISETSPQQIELLYRTGKINLPDKIQALRTYGQMKRELQIRDMSAAGTGGAFGEINNYIIGVANESAKAWAAAKDLKAGKAVFHTLMTGLEALKAYDIPGNIVERKFLEAGMEPSYARAANWATWIPANFVGISRTLQLPFKAAGAGIRTVKAGPIAAIKAGPLGKYTNWLKDPVGAATESAMKLNKQETEHILSQLDQAIMQSETGQALKKVADAVTGAEAVTGPVVTSAKEAPGVSAEVMRRGQEFLAGAEGAAPIPSPDAFEKAAISDLIKFYEQKANVYIRKGVSHAETEAQAVGKMSFEEIISRPPGQAMSAAELAYTARVNDAIRNGMESTIKDALPHLDDIAGGKRNDLVGLFKAHFSAFAQTNPVFLGASGEVGRGLEFMKVLQPEVQAARMYDGMLKGLGSDMLAESSDAAIAKALLKLSVMEKDARKAFLEAGAKSDNSPSIWHSLYKSLLFIVPATHVANFAGQNQGAMLQLMQHTGAALAGGEGAPGVAGAWAAWKGYGSAWLHLPRIMRIASERSMEPLEKLGLEGAKDTVARYGPARWLGFGDELVGAALEQGFVKENLINRGLEKGLIGKGLADFVNEQSALPEIIKDIEETVNPVVKHAMYHDPLSPLSESVATRIRNSKLDFWMPVVKFPLNSLKAARDWTPGLQMLSSKFADDLAAGGAREAEARSRVTLSWMFSNYLWGEGKTGAFTGGGPVDPEKNKAWQAAGNVPYSLHGVPYRWFEPLGTMMGTVADMAYFSNQMEPDDVEDFTAGLGVTLSRMIENNWWLRSMEGVTGMVSSMHSAQKTNEFFKAAAKFVGAPFVTVATGGPLGSKIREIRDPEVKQINGFGDYFLAKVPAFGYSKDVAPQLNYSGATKEIPPILGHRWLNLVLPSGLRGEGTKDPVGAFLYKHGLELPDNWKSYGGSVDPEKPFFEPGQGKLETILDSNQSHNWKSLSLTEAKRYDGTGTDFQKKNGITWVEKIMQLDNDQAFNDKSRYQKQNRVSLLYHNYRKKGGLLLESVDPEIKLKNEAAKAMTKQMRGKMPADVEDQLDTQPEDTQAVEPTPMELPSDLGEVPAAEQGPAVPQ